MTVATDVERTPIYTTPNGYQVYEMSHSQFSVYKTCPKRFYFERILGWRQKPGGAMMIGHSIQGAIEAFYREEREPVETFETLWGLEREDQSLTWKEGESWETFRVAGVGLMTRFKRDWKDFPPRKPVFFNYKDRRLLRDAGTKNDYATIPDLIDRDERGEFLADIKCQGKLLSEKLVGQVALDRQICTQAAATGIYRVALWNFCRKPKRPEPLPSARVYDEVRAGIGGLRYQQLPHIALTVAREVNGTTIDETGVYLGIPNSQELAKEWNKLKKEDPSLFTLAGEIAKTLSAIQAPVYKIQWLEATISKEYAFDAVRDEMSVVPLIKANYFPRRGGIRFPDDHCGFCPTRGLCLEELLGPRPEYDEITREELVRIDDKALAF